MRISGNEPSSVILDQKRGLKVEKGGRKVPKQAEAKRDVHICPIYVGPNSTYM